MDQDIFYIPSAVCVGSRWGIVEADRGVSLMIVAVIPILLSVELVLDSYDFPQIVKLLFFGQIRTTK